MLLKIFAAKNNGNNRGDDRVYFNKKRGGGSVLLGGKGRYSPFRVKLKNLPKRDGASSSLPSPTTARRLLDELKEGDDFDEDAIVEAYKIIKASKAGPSTGEDNSSGNI